MPAIAVSPIKQIIDLSHELYDGMPNLGGWKVAFPQIDSFELRNNRLSSVGPGQLQ